MFSTAAACVCVMNHHHRIYLGIGSKQYLNSQATVCLEEFLPLSLLVSAVLLLCVITEKCYQIDGLKD